MKAPEYMIYDSLDLRENQNERAEGFPVQLSFPNT